MVKCTSSSGGTGTLTCSAQTSYVTPAALYTGTRILNYEIREWTDSTKTVLSLWERGTGSYNTSTEVLTRTKVLYTWSGSAYLPKFGTATAPTAISFGTTAANIDIVFSPFAVYANTTIPFQSGAVASVSDGLGTSAINIGTANTAIGLTSGTVYYFPLLICSQGPFSQFSFRSTTTLTGGSPTYDCAIYEVGSDGLPGKRLINFTQKTAIGTTNTTYTSTALATPIYLVPGWYYAAVLYLAASATGTFTPKGAALLSSGPQGTLFANGTAFVSYFSLASQTVLNDPATAPTANVNQTVIPFVCFK